MNVNDRFRPLRASVLYPHCKVPAVYVQLVAENCGHPRPRLSLELVMN